MFRSPFAQCLSIFLALSATSLSAPHPQGWGNPGNGGWSYTVTVIEGAGGMTTVAPSTSSTSSTSSTTSTPSGTASTTTPLGTTAAAPSATSTSIPTDAGGKRGIAYNSSSPDLDVFNSYSNVGWGVDWSSNRAELPGQYEFVPQLWSDAPEHTGSWVSDVETANPSHVLSFNEPDIPSQANMPVGSAVASHITWMNDRANGGAVKIGSVSVSNGVKANDGDPPMGLEYLEDFLTQCAAAKPTPCVVNFASVHWYGCTNGCGVDADLAAFRQQMSDAITAANGLDVWITEFQHFGSEQDQQSFISQALIWLDDPAQGKIKKYAYFMVLDGILTTGGSLNSAGTAYAS